MAIDLHMAPDLADSAIRADQDRGAKNALERPAIHRFFAPDAVGLEHLMLLIRNERRGELMLVPKGFLRLRGISRDPQYGGPTVAERAPYLREVDRPPVAPWLV